ncbi:MAG: hypothetical protein RI967_290 [Planctomycetota bacterium]|jgi:MYXO-CTERM domain-containing protein
MQLSNTRPIALAVALAASAIGSAANAYVVLDNFSGGAQSVFTTSTADYTTSISGQTSIASTSPIAAMGMRMANVSWSTAFNQNGLLTEAQQLARVAGFSVDSNAGLGIFSFDGRLATANIGLAYNAAAGQSVDFGALGTGLRLDGALTGLSGATNAFFQNLSLDVRITDNAGITANHTWFANELTGGFGGLANPLEADFSAFLPAFDYQTLDLSSIVSLEINLSYNYTGFALAPQVSGEYQLGSVSFVPAPGALALLGLAGLTRRSRR